jgi:IclR helix-turn-helix domain
MSSSSRCADGRRRDESVSDELLGEPDPRSGDRPNEASTGDAHGDRASADGAHTDRAGAPDGRVAGSGEPLVSITLSRNQVDHVMRSALGEEAGPNMSGLITGVGFHTSHARHALGARYRSLQDNRRLSRSLLSGLLVLSCFPPKGVDLGIKDISKELDLNTSTVHRYVLTLVAAGLLERDPDTRRYRLVAE